MRTLLRPQVMITRKGAFAKGQPCAAKGNGLIASLLQIQWGKGYQHSSSCRHLKRENFPKRVGSICVTKKLGKFGVQKEMKFSKRAVIKVLYFLEISLETMVVLLSTEA